jgi:hypothetical protein
MFATLAGPWLCCCQQSRLRARFVSLLQNEEAKLADDHHSCCQHRVPMEDSQPANPSDAPSCPCKGKSQESPALGLLKSDGIERLDRGPYSQAESLLDCDPFSGVATSSFNRMLQAFALPTSVLSGRDMLSSLHILRC